VRLSRLEKAMQANGIAKHRALYSAPAVGMHAAALDGRTDGRNAIYTRVQLRMHAVLLIPRSYFEKQSERNFCVQAHEAKADLQSDLMVA
jgi:hypothetical protein